MNPLPETSALYFMSAAECSHVHRHELGVCLERCAFMCVVLNTVDLQRGRSLGSPHAVFRHTRVSPLVLLSHFHQTESVVTADLESSPGQRKEQLTAFVRNFTHAHSSVLTSKTIVLSCDCLDIHSLQPCLLQKSPFNRITDDSNK